MKNINWILQKNLIDENTFKSLKNAILLDNAEYQEVYIIPFSEDLPFDISKDKNNILYPLDQSNQPYKKG